MRRWLEDAGFHIGDKLAGVNENRLVIEKMVENLGI